MQIDRKVLEQALEALERSVKLRDEDYDAMDAFKAALEQPEQEPQTFEEFLATDAGVRMGLKLKDEWSDAARVGWEAAMRAKQENV